MPFTNALTQKLGIRFPIVQGPFGGGLSSIELASTVSGAGGLGSFGAHHLAPDAIRTLVQDIRQATQAAFAINLWVSNRDHHIDGISRSKFDSYLRAFEPYYNKLDIDPPAFTEVFSHDFEKQAEAAIAAEPPALSFVYGVPGRHIIEACRAKGIVTMGTATTVDEALALEAGGVDVIVATGFEAGGHRVSFLKEPENCLTGTLALVPQIVDAVNLPVIAAGGIADIRGVRAALALGAHGVQVGTAFLACRQSGTSDLHRDILMTDQAHHTVLSRAFTGRLARFIENDFIRDVERCEDPPAPFPVQSFFTAPIKSAANTHANGDYASLYAGQGASLLKHTDAADLLLALAADFH